MPPHFKTVMLICSCLVLICSLAHAQTDSSYLTDSSIDSYEDDEFNLFLFSLVALFMCGLFGAAFIGALAAGFIIALLFFITAFGLVSTATVIGIYKRSFSAGFSSFLMFVFGAGCSLIGCAGFFILDVFFQLPVSRISGSIIGLASGVLGGMLLGSLSVKMIQYTFRIISQKLKASTR